MSEEEKSRYREVGLDILAEGTTALVLLAGGQASRLQISAVKGDIDIGLPSRVFSLQKSLSRQNTLPACLQPHQVHSKQGGRAIGQSASTPRLRHDLRIQHSGHAGQYPSSLFPPSFTHSLPETTTTVWKRAKSPSSSKVRFRAWTPTATSLCRRSTRCLRLLPVT